MPALKRPPTSGPDILRLPRGRAAAPAAPLIDARPPGAAPAVFVAALLFTALTGVYLRLNLRQRERAKQAEERLRDAIASLAEGFALYDRDDCLVMCNEAYRQMCPEPAERLRQPRDPADPVEVRLADGRWLLVSEQPTRDGGRAGLRIDITALKKAEAELRASREHLALAQRVSGVGSLERDLISGRGNVCTDVLCAIFGVDPDHFDPSLENVLSLIHPDDRPLVERTIAQVNAAAVEAPPLEFRLIRPDGTVRWVRREHSFIRDEAGRAVRKLVTFLDVTELRTAKEREAELQKQLLHSQRLEALGTLAGGVAHDLNNLLVPILATAKLVLDDLPADSLLREDIETIVFASEQARNLVKQILAFSRKQEAFKSEVDPAAVVRKTLQMLRATLPRTIHIEEDIAAVPPILADPGQLQQILVNLVTNSAQAIGDAVGTIAIDLALVQGRGDFVRLSVADTGCGIEKEVIDRIFEPYFTTKEVGAGSGLGLSVVHGIVADHGGEIAVNSEPGKGTVFVITLPATRAAAAAPVALAT